ncbi:hypothetical protein N5U14_11540 [Aliarcobacter butzleri]|uniref:hypothetical protein n=1 Tax=Aliarcobacter butzleri TaxID=28197 RepID=UPI0021B29043|nr:hypothetical protein [Aliarcobacter butzleri]MCT7611470.1 hypothetical protein [Aliarcobacter butzleri]
MSRKILKGKILKELISKAIDAEKNGFYLESIFLCHSIIEERLRSTILKVDQKFGNKHKIPGSIKRFNNYIKNKEFLFNRYFDEKELKKINKWKKLRRDNLIHELEKNDDLINNENELYKIAAEGQALMRQLNKTVMKWKKNVIKEKII